MKWRKSSMGAISNARSLSESSARGAGEVGAGLKSFEGSELMQFGERMGKIDPSPTVTVAARFLRQVSSRLLKKSQARARQGKNRRESAVYTQYMSILSRFFTQDRAV
jgi:hypothetical protein